MKKSLAIICLIASCAIICPGCMVLPIFPKRLNTAIAHNNVFWSEVVPLWLLDREYRERFREYRQKKKLNAQVEQANE